VRAAVGFHRSRDQVVEGVRRASVYQDIANGVDYEQLNSGEFPFAGDFGRYSAAGVCFAGAFAGRVTFAGVVFGMYILYILYSLHQYILYGILRLYMDDKRQRYVNILFDEDTLERVDNFRFEQRFASRTEAIRWLIKAALDKKLKPGKPVTKGD